MSVPYDKYYQTENLFGNPYPELIAFYSSFPQKGKLLDVGCGQGRDAIALARLGYEVKGIDHSKVGIEQMNELAQKENLPLKGIVWDLFEYPDFGEFDFILLDSMFHFQKKEKAKEIALLKKIFSESRPNTLITICIQQTGNKVAILDSIITEDPKLEIIHQEAFLYKFEDKDSKHSSETNYKMISVKKSTTLEY